MRPKPLALIIMDGWGETTKTIGNALAQADTPYIDQLKEQYPTTLLRSSGAAVGLPDGQMGNSEVGHLNIGSGRIVYQDFTRISLAIENNELPDNEELKKAMKDAKDKGQALHLMGLLSDGGVHSHIQHLFGLLDMAKELGLTEVYIHPILDGRDTPPTSGLEYIKQLEKKMKEIDLGQIATVSGRYYTMDRDNRWERTEKSYRAMVDGKGNQANSAIESVKDSYKNDKTDEFMIPTVILEDGSPVKTIGEGDSIIFFNFRADRARQITRALALPEFDGFDRGQYLNPHYVCMTEYDETFDLPVAFPPLDIKKTLTEVLSKANIKQLRIAETEKYAHVTFFFNGGKEVAVKGEDRELIPSPKVATYDEKPSMSAEEVTDTLLKKLEDDTYDVIVLNYANCDMVGHTGDETAAIEAAEVVDESLKRLVPVILEKGGQVLLTADHGNAEQMKEEDGDAFTAHTTNPVPFIYIGGPDGSQLRDGGILADIAPTMLKLLEIDQPEEMTGKTLIK